MFGAPFPLLGLLALTGIGFSWCLLWLPAASCSCAWNRACSRCCWCTACGFPWPGSALRAPPWKQPSPGTVGKHRSFLAPGEGQPWSGCVHPDRVPGADNKNPLINTLHPGSLPSSPHFSPFLPYRRFLGSLPSSTGSVQILICQNQASFKVLKLPGKEFHLGNHVPKCVSCLLHLVHPEEKQIANQDQAQNKDNG